MSLFKLYPIKKFFPISISICLCSSLIVFSINFNLKFIFPFLIKLTTHQLFYFFPPTCSSPNLVYSLYKFSLQSLHNTLSSLFIKLLFYFLSHTLSYPLFFFFIISISNYYITLYHHF